MSGYTKLFESILESTVWLESPPVKVVWITLLAMADRDGCVEASVPGLAKRAGVERPYCEQALAKFLSPDPDSRTPDHEGRRLEAIPGGWRLLNYETYRERATKEEATNKATERQRRKRERDKALQGVTAVTNHAGHAIAEAGKQEAGSRKAESSTEGPPEPAAKEWGWALQPDQVTPHKVSPLEVIAVWNETVTSPIPKASRLTPERTKRITARLVSYPNLSDWILVIGWLNRQAWCRAPGTGNHPTWTATLDWLCKSDDNVQKHLEQAQAHGSAAPAAKPRTVGGVMSAEETDRYRKNLRKLS